MAATDEPKRNETHIRQAKAIQAEIDTVIGSVKGKFNNREMSLVVTKLQEAKMWAGQYAETLE